MRFRGRCGVCGAETVGADSRLGRCCGQPVDCVAVEEGESVAYDLTDLLADKVDAGELAGQSDVVIGLHDVVLVLCRDVQALQERTYVLERVVEEAAGL